MAQPLIFKNMTSLFTELEQALKEVRTKTEVFKQKLQEHLKTNNLAPEKEEKSTMTVRQARLLWYYDIFGIIGVAYCVKCIAEEQIKLEASQGRCNVIRPQKRRKTSIRTEDWRDPEDDYGDSEAEEMSEGEDPNVDMDEDEESVKTAGHSSWKAIIQDYELGQDSRMIYMLASQPPELLRTIMTGTLPSKMEDQEFARIVGPWINLDDEPAIYGVFVGVSAVEDRRNAGKGLKLREMINVIGDMSLYLDVEDPRSADFARKVDDEYGPYTEKLKKLNYEQGQRKFGSGNRRIHLDKQREWVRTLQDIYVKKFESLKGTSEDYLIDEHLDRCLPYVGLSINCSKRASSHWHHEVKESPCYGLFTSVVRWRLGRKYETKSHTYVLYRAVKEEDLGLYEIIVSVISSAFRWDGGLNLHHAGGSGGAPNKAKLAKAAKRIEDSGFIHANIKDSADKIQAVNCFLDTWQSKSLQSTEWPRCPQVETIEEQLQDLEQQEAAVRDESDLLKYVAVDNELDDLLATLDSL